MVLFSLTRYLTVLLSMHSRASSQPQTVFILEFFQFSMLPSSDAIFAFAAPGILLAPDRVSRTRLGTQPPGPEPLLCGFLPVGQDYLAGFVAWTDTRPAERRPWRL
jgi:hypothetical protein